MNGQTRIGDRFRRERPQWTRFVALACLQLHRAVHPSSVLSCHDQSTWRNTQAITQHSPISHRGTPLTEVLTDLCVSIPPHFLVHASPPPIILHERLHLRTCELITINFTNCGGSAILRPFQTCSTRRHTSGRGSIERNRACRG
jgi:hypothetical protein